MVYKLTYLRGLRIRHPAKSFKIGMYGKMNRLDFEFKMMKLNKVLFYEKYY